MFRLLNIEYQKLRHNKSSRVLTIIYFGLLLSIAAFSLIKFGDFQLAKEGIYDFPYIWHLNTFIAAILKFFLLLVIVSLVANEYTYKTLKQNLIDGLSKKEFVLSKFYMAVVLALLSTVFVFIISMILGWCYSSIREFRNMFLQTDYLLAYFVKLVGFFSFGIFAAVLIKRSAFAVGAIFIWSIIEGLFKLFFMWKLSDEMTTTLMRFFPLEAMANLIKEPFSRFKGFRAVAKRAEEGVPELSGLFNKDYSVQYLDVMIVLAWTAIFIYLAYRLIQKRDL